MLARIWRNWNPVYQFIYKLNIELLSDPANPLAHTQLKAGTQTDICKAMLTEALFTTAKRQEQLKCPLTDECISCTHE